MDKRRSSYWKSVSIAILTLLFFPSRPIDAEHPGSPPGPGLSESGPGTLPCIISNLPLSFEPNQGQADAPVRLLSRGPLATVYLEPSGIALQPSGSAEPRPALGRGRGPSVLRLSFAGGNPSAEVTGEERLPGRSHYYIGNDPKKWRTNVPHYARARFQDVYPGVDVVFYGNQRQMEFDFIIEPAGDPTAIRLSFEGAKKLRIDGGGNLIIPAGDGQVCFHKPYIYQGSKSAAEEVAGAFLLLGDDLIGFRVGPYDPTQPLVIDPILSYSTFYGGSSSEAPMSLAEDPSGNIYFCGQIDHANLPVRNALQPAYGGGRFDGFVGKLNAAGNAMAYITYLGGTGRDVAKRVAADISGNAYVVGSTDSTNFPLMNPFQSKFGGSSIGIGDGFVTKLNADGSALLYSTYLGGSADDVVQGVAVDAGGNAYVMGDTRSTNFPTANPFQPALRGEGDAFLTKLNSSGTALVYSTYFGGTGSEVSYGFGGGNIAIDANGCAYVFGFTDSSDFPVVNAYQSAYRGGGRDCFVTKFNSGGSAVVFSTYLGGGGDDRSSAIAVAPSGLVGVTGRTKSTDFPTRNPIQASLSGTTDAFVTVLNPDGSSALYSTYLGGGGDEQPNAIAVSPSGTFCVAGATGSTDFPVSNAIQSSPSAEGDIFLSMFNYDGSSLPFSTYLGGNSGEYAMGVGFDAAGNIYLGGATGSSDFPTVNPLQATHGGEVDIFIARIQMVATGPAPALSSISPSSAQAGDPGVNLRVRGSDFLDGATVRWDGSQRPTNYVSSSELSASISANDLAAGKVVQVTVANPGGGVSNALPFSISNPAPVLTAISPIKALAGGADFTLTLTGSGFVANSVVRWNSKDKTTTYVSGTELKAAIQAADLTAGGPVTVTVSNPAPGGGVSGAVSFTVVDFEISASPASTTISAGQTATYQVSLSPKHGSYDTAVTLSCSGLPTPCTSSFSPASVTPGASGATSTLTLSTQSSVASLIKSYFGLSSVSAPGSGPGLLLLALALVLTVRLLRDWKKRPRPLLARLAAAMCLAALLATCGGGGSGSDPEKKTGTPAGSYTLTIEGKVGSVTHSATVTLVVK